MSIKTLLVTGDTENQQCNRTISTLAVPVSHAFPSTILGHLQYPFDGIQAYKTHYEMGSFVKERRLTFCQVGERRAKGESDEVVTRRVEQITAVGWVDIEEYSGNHDCLLFEQFFEECLHSGSVCSFKCNLG
jgi:hypothetical protein